MTGSEGGITKSKLAIACAAALIAGLASVAVAAPKKPDGAKRVDIPLPVLAPWHNRPAALGKGPNAKPRANKAANSKKAKAVAKKKSDATEEQSVTALLAEDPNVWPDDDINENLKACVSKLALIQARVEIAKPFRKGACGAPAAVRIKKLGTRHPVTFSPPATLRCDMAVSLYQFVEESLQPAAVEHLGSPIVSFNGISTYSCRNRNGDPGGKLSEHALANALDVGTFKLANGKKVKVISDWGPTKRDLEEKTDPVVQPVAKKAKPNGKVQLASLDAPKLTRRQLRRLERQNRRRAARVVPPMPIKKSVAIKMKSPVTSKLADRSLVSKAKSAVLTKKPASNKALKRVAKAPAKVTKKMRFLKRVHKDACKYFGTVLGPEANEAHRDHFHFDMAPRRRSNYCR